MAMIKCKECDKDVSDKAKVCPHCGVKSPKKTSKIETILTFAIIFSILYFFFSSDEEEDTKKESPQKQKITAKSKPIPTSPKAEKLTPITWLYTDSIDPMTGERSHYAVSIARSPQRKMGFPNDDVKAWLSIGCKNGKKWAYVNFLDAPNLNDTETKDGYSIATSRIKWDERLETVSLHQQWEGKGLHFQKVDQFIKNIRNSNKALVELNWYSEGLVYFEFSLKGSSAILDRTFEACVK